MPASLFPKILSSARPDVNTNDRFSWNKISKSLFSITLMFCMCVHKAEMHKKNICFNKYLCTYVQGLPMSISRILVDDEGVCLCLLLCH